MRKAVSSVLLAGLFLGSSYAYADPAVIETFDAIGNCIDQDGNLQLTETTRQVVITNDDEGTINLVIKGTCTNTSGSAVNFDSETFPIVLGCNAGSVGVVFYWKYHMRPDGQYTTKCSSNPLDD